MAERMCDARDNLLKGKSYPMSMLGPWTIPNKRKKKTARKEESEAEESESESESEAASRPKRPRN